MTMSTAAPPTPIPDASSQFFWDGVAREELWILRCQSCGHYIHLPKPMCRFCQSQELSPEHVSGRAKLYSWTVAMQAFHPYFAERIPYTIATVELVEQPRLMFVTNIVDCAEESLRDQMELEVVFPEVAEGLKLPLFRPVTHEGTT
jgi:uncharacterized OB-fold protein